MHEKSAASKDGETTRSRKVLGITGMSEATNPREKQENSSACASRASQPGCELDAPRDF
jgi:hypothetical protein